MPHICLEVNNPLMPRDAAVPGHALLGWGTKTASQRADRAAQSSVRRACGCLCGIVPLLLALSGCASVPSGLTPVTGFDADRYLGTWFEIARLDHPFERGLENVSAEYEKRPDGAITVINRGYDASRQRWREARGVARFRESPSVGSLKVTFFWPFTGGYHVIALDRDYRWAMVAGPSRKYLWILSREPSLAPDVYEQLVQQARAMGFPVDGLIRVSHASNRQARRHQTGGKAEQQSG